MRPAFRQSPRTPPQHRDKCRTFRACWASRSACVAGVPAELPPEVVRALQAQAPEVVRALQAQAPGVVRPIAWWGGLFFWMHLAPFVVHLGELS